MSGDSLWTANPLIPYLDFRIIDSKGEEWSLTWDEGKGQFSPSIAVDFTYKQRAPSLGGGAWSLSVNDPTFALMEVLTDVFGFVDGGFETYTQGQALGKVKFRFGYATSDKEPQLTDFVHGYILMIRPNIRHRSKLDFLMNGYDLSIVDINQNLIVTPEMLTGTLGQILNVVVTSMESQAGADQYKIIYSDDSLANIPVGKMKAGITDSIEPHLAAYLVGSSGNASGISLMQFLTLLQDLITGQGMMIHIDVSGTDVDGVQVINVIRNRMIGKTVPIFNVNSTQSKSGDPNESRVVNFDPSLMPITTGLLGAGQMNVQAVDPDTLEVKTVTVESDKNPSVSVSDGLYSIANIPVYGGNMASSFSPEIAQQYLQVQQAYLANMVIQGTLKTKFTPYIDLLPYDYIRVNVSTPSSRLFFTSGVYMITEIDHTLSNQGLDTTYTLISSGTRGVQNTEVKAGEVNNYE